MNVNVVGFEARRCGIATLLTPLVVAAGILGASRLAAGGEGTPEMVGVGMVRLVADVLPVTVGLAAASALSRERMTELHLTLPTSLIVTILRRVGLILAAATVASAVAIAGLMTSRQWWHPATGATAMLVPLGPSILLVGVACYSTTVTRSGAASAAIVLAAWLGQLLILDRFLGVWQMNRLMLAGLGLVALAMAARRIADGDTVLKGESS